MRPHTLMVVRLYVALTCACNVPLDSFHGKEVAADATIDVTTTATGSCVQPPAGIVAWWPGDNNDALLGADISGNHHQGMLSGGATYADGQVSRAFSVNGTGAFVEIPSFAVAQALSVEFWVYPFPHVVSGLITMSNNSSTDPGWSIGYYGATDSLDGIVPQHIVFSVVESATSSFYIYSCSNSVPIGKWTHVAATTDGNTMHLYVNGSEVSANSAPSPQIVPSSSSILLGAFQRNQIKEQFFNGLLDEVTVYNRRLSSDEIRAIFEAGTAGKCKS